PWETSAGAEPVCPAEAGVLVPERPIAGATPPDGLPIGVLERNGARYLLATFSLPDDIPDALQGADAEFELRFAAAGDTETIGPEQPEAVATTGVAIAVPLL